MAARISEKNLYPISLERGAQKGFNGVGHTKLVRGIRKINLRCAKGLKWYKKMSWNYYWVNMKKNTLI